MQDFLKIAKQFARWLPFVRDAVAMYFCMLDEQTPAWAKAAIAAALGYFLMPTDAIPDFVAGLGFTDDAGVIATTLSMVLSVLTDRHRKQADEFLNS
ncbi:YkvA family protein [Leptodesmis sp.]|uniref:YkvA family protein n=1 Tax=Leptodesmis sp. TaxID=3100501 RepID=UPI0040535AA6